MSGISGISGSDSSIYEILLQASKSTESDETATTQSGLLGVEAATTNEQGVDNLRSQIDAAISDALAGLDKSSSADEIKQAVQDAVDSVMEANGIDPEDMKTQLPPPPPPPPAEDSSETSDEDDDESATTVTDPFMAKLEELLDENGFDGASIISQLQAEITEQGGAFGLLQNIQSQTGLDTTA